MTDAKRQSYVGKAVFVGIDVHRKHYAVSCVCEGMVVKRCRMEASPAALLAFLQKYFPGATLSSAYEAGFSGFVLHRYLAAHGVANIVVNPASIEIAARNKVKTDTIDSRKLAEQLAVGRLHSIRIPSEEEEARRTVTRTRDQLRKERARVMNRIRMRLHQFGLLSPTLTGTLRLSTVQHVISTHPDLYLRRGLEILVSLWTTLSQQITLLDQEFKHQNTEDSLSQVYQRVPGYGALIARVLVNELGDLQQFQNERQLFSFTGLTPQEYSSGDTRRLGHISRQGSSRLRHVLVEGAWAAIRQDPGLRQDFERIAARQGKKRAIIAIARKLIGRARALFRKHEGYQVRVHEAV